MPVTEHWAERAACNTGDGSLTYLFYSTDAADKRDAKAICATCPVTEECLADSDCLPDSLDQGIRAGLERPERRYRRYQQRRNGVAS